MVNQTTCTLYELWQARYSANGSTAGSGAVWNLSISMFGPGGMPGAPRQKNSDRLQ